MVEFHTGERARAAVAEAGLEAAAKKIDGLEADVDAARAEIGESKRVLEATERQRAAERDALLAERAAARNRATAAERKLAAAERRVDDLGRRVEHEARAHLGARHALERSKRATEGDVSLAVSRRRAALDDVDRLRERLAVEVKCRASAASQLKELRAQRDADRSQRDRDAADARKLEIKYKKLKAEVEEHRRQRDAAGLDASLATSRGAARSRSPPPRAVSKVRRAALQNLSGAPLGVRRAKAPDQTPNGDGGSRDVSPRKPSPTLRRQDDVPGGSSLARVVDASRTPPPPPPDQFEDHPLLHMPPSPLPVPRGASPVPAAALEEGGQ